MAKPVIAMERLFKALADATRLRILGLLLTGEVCVCDIHESLRIPQPKASRHLAYLRRAGLVATRRDGLWVHYRLAEPPDATVRTVLNAAVHTLGRGDGPKAAQALMEVSAGDVSVAVRAEAVAALGRILQGRFPREEGGVPGDPSPR